MPGDNAMRRPCFVLLVALATALSLTAMGTAQTEVVGCLSRIPDGTLQVGAIPSGESYVLHGQAQVLERHISQVVRITGRAESSSTVQGPRVLTVDTAHAVAGSCSAVLPPTRLEAPAGKVGADVTATAVTATASMDETTPGFQTEAMPPAAAAQYLQRPNYAPAQPDQASESAIAADTNAQAAQRAEILPGNSLGVSKSPAASPAPSSTNASARENSGVQPSR